MKKNENSHPNIKKSNIPYRIGLTLILSGALYATFGFIFGFFTLYINNPIAVFEKNIPNHLETDQVRSLLESVIQLNNITGYKLILIGFISVLAVVAGFRLIQFQMKGKKLAVYWAITAIAYLVIELLIEYLLIHPVSAELKTQASAVISKLGTENTDISFLSKYITTQSTAKPLQSLIRFIIFSIIPVLTLIFILPKKINKSLSD